MSQPTRTDDAVSGHWREESTAEGLVVEAWGQGFFVGALVIMACLTIAAMSRRVLLHKLILAEVSTAMKTKYSGLLTVQQLLAMPHGTFCFMSFSGYGWYVSWTATLLFSSYIMHNVVAWLKVKPFFIGKSPSYFSYRTGKMVQWIYCVSLALTVPVWIFNAYNNFEWNISTSTLYRRVRPFECLVRDPWWIFTNVVLLHIIGRSYGMSVFELVRKSPRLGILLLAIVFAIAFTIIDLVATILEGKLGNVDGINPYWKLSLVFKCLTDAIMLDDFATELKRIGGDKDLPTHSNHNHANFPEGNATHKRSDGDTIDSTIPDGREAAGSGPISKRPTTTKAQLPTVSGGNCLEIEDIGRLAS